MVALLSASQLGALQTVAKLGMTDTITIQRQALADSDYADDEVATYSTVGTSIAWLRSTPTAVAVADTGALITANTYRLLVPTGTDIRARDQILHGSDAYIVTDTTVESTWKVYLTVSLRKRE